MLTVIEADITTLHVVAIVNAKFAEGYCFPVHYVIQSLARWGKRRSRTHRLLLPPLPEHHHRCLGLPREAVREDCRENRA